MKIMWTKKELEKLKWVGKKLRKALAKIPSPQEPKYPKDTAEMLAIWDEEGWSMQDIENLIGKEVIYKGKINHELK